MSRRKHRPRDRTREELLDAGINLLLAQPAPGVEHIKATAVVASVGLSSGAFYNIWDSQQRYHHDLLAWVFDPDRWPVTAAAELTVNELTVDGVPFETIVAEVARLAWTEAVNNQPLLRLQLALWASNDPITRQRLSDQYTHVGRQWADVIDMLIRAHHRTLRAPFTADTLGLTLTALLEGMIVRCDVDTSHDPPTTSTDTRQELFIDAVLALAESIVTNH